MKIPSRITLAQGNAAEFQIDGSRRRFQMIAYTGAAMDAAFGTMIIDLDGLEIGRTRKPILRQHDPNRIAGYSDVIEKSDRLVMRGALSAKTDAGREVAELADEGFPWQASVGIDIDKVDVLEAGSSRTVNGQVINGPAMVISKSMLREASFVPLGADGATSAVVFARDSAFIDVPEKTQETNMDLTIESLKANHPGVFKAAYDEGFGDGQKSAAPKPAGINELRAAFPDDKDFVLDQLAADAPLLAAKAAFADLQTRRLAEARKQIAELEAKVNQLSAAQGPIAVNAAAGSAPADPDDPAAVAASEWDTKPDVRVGFSSRDRYIRARAAELRGQLRVLR